MRRRIVLTAIVVCGLGIVVLFVPAALVVRDQNRHQDLLELQRLAAVAVHQLPGRPDAISGPLPVPADREHRYGVYDTARRRLAGDGPPTADPVVDAALTATAAAGIVGDEAVGAVSMGPGGGVVTGAVRAAEPLQESDARTQAAITGLAALAAAALAAAAGAGWLLFRRLLRPLDALSAAAARLGDGDFTVTAPRSEMPELDQVADALDAAGNRIGRLVERERAFSADASHQLRTPLAAARLAVETELMAPCAGRSAALHEILEALDRMTATVDELLQLARDDHVTRVRLSVTDLLTAARERWARLYCLNDRPLHATTGDLDHVAQVHASPTALGHILDVLLDNALHHGVGPVTLAAEPVPHGVAITVFDAGTAPPNPHQVFWRRQSGPAGTGIGLALARTLAAAEGARLQLRQQPPTTFELLLPTPDAVPVGDDAAHRGTATTPVRSTPTSS